MTEPKFPVDYQPISVLPILSEVYKNVIVSQMTTFTETKLLYHKYQSGYLKNNFTFKNKRQH